MHRPPLSIYRAAIVGTGGIAAVHAQAIALFPDRASLVAAVDVDASRLDAFAEKWNVPHRYPDLGTLLAAEEIDVVHICTPPQTHAALATQCLEANVIPLIEKPPAMSLAQFDELITLERSSTVSVACVFQQRFGSAAIRLKGLAGSGVLGRPLLALANTLWYRGDEYFAAPWRGSWQAEGGGPTMGHGIHQIDLLLSVLGPWENISAVASRQSRPTDTEDVSVAIVEFENGAIATVMNSLVSPQQRSQVRFDFERATAEAMYLYSYDDADWVVTPLADHAGILSAWSADRDEESSGHAAQFRAVYDALDEGVAPPVTLEDVRPTIEFIAALYASAFTRQRVRRGELDATSPYAVTMGGGGAPWLAAASNPEVAQ